MNLYKQHAAEYLEKGFSIIPDKFGTKTPAIKGWTEYCNRQPTSEEIEGFCAIGNTNIAVAMGEASGIIALDVDSTDQKILDLIVPMLPASPVEKVGAKGFTRFFRYNGENSLSVKFNGEMVLEILSEGKKTTLPPSRHPSGVDYRYTSTETLLTVNREALPFFPPFLLANIESKLKLHFGDLESRKGNSEFIAGRNNALSQLCGQLIADRDPVEVAVNKLIEHDKTVHKQPLFTDPNEMMSTDAFTNALAFYSNHLQTANNRHYRKGEAYETPIVNVMKEVLGKRLGEAKLQRKKRDLPSPANGVIKTIQSWILENSWVPQPAFAFSAALAVVGTLASRKFIFQGSTTNTYLLNIGGSGSGKDFPQQAIKEIFSIIKADKLLGAGDYISDASLMDSLAMQPVRLDIMDEAGGILRSVTAGKSEYNGKMADILAELYTTSTSKYLGRALSEGVRGSCYRPHVNILASTTPTGFSEGVTVRAIEKGLLGRFLIFFGSHDTPAKRLYKKSSLDFVTLEQLRFLVNYEPTEETLHVGDIPQLCDELKATKRANERLDQIFEEVDNLRRTTSQSSNLLPIIARLYQQMAKIVMIHAVSRCDMTRPIIDIEDVEFGYQTIMYYYDLIQEVVENYIHDSRESAEIARVLKIISDHDIISKQDLVRITRFLDKKKRESILLDLIDGGQIQVFAKDNKTFIEYLG